MRRTTITMIGTALKKAMVTTRKYLTLKKIFTDDKRITVMG